MELQPVFWELRDRDALEAEAIRRGWLSPDWPAVIDFSTVQQNRPRDPGVVTFKDWLDARD